MLTFAAGPLTGGTLGLAVVPIIATQYAVADVGRLAIAQIVVTLAAQVLPLGLDQAMVREFHEVADQSRLLRSSITPGLVATLALLVPLLLWPQEFSGRVYGIGEAWLGLMTAFLLVAAYINRYLTLLLRLREKAMFFSISIVLQRASQLVILLALTARSDHVFADLLFALAASTVLNTVFLIVCSSHLLVQAAKSRSSASDVLKGMRYGVPLMLASLALWGIGSADRIILRRLSNLEELGLYGLTSNLAYVAVVLQTIFATIWAPTVVRWMADGDAQVKTPQVREYANAGYVLLLGLLGSFSWVVAWVLPSEYEQTQRLLVAVALGPLLVAVGETTVVGVNIVRRTTWSLLAALAALVISLAGNLTLDGRYGARGAAMASVFAYQTFFVLRTEFASRAWVRLPRARLYGSTSVCSALAVTMLWVDGRATSVVSIFWMLTAALGCVWVFRLVQDSLSPTSPVTGDSGPLSASRGQFDSDGR